MDGFFDGVSFLMSVYDLFFFLTLFFLLPYCSVIAVAVMHGFMYALLTIPLGFHAILNLLASTFLTASFSILFRSNITILPFEEFLVCFLSVAMDMIFYKGLHFIPVRDTRTYEPKRWEIAQWFLPPSHRFDLKVTAGIMRVDSTCQLAYAFAFMYPLIGGLFFQSGIFVQALLIPVFFILRASFEYGADAITSHTFGSDCMPGINFGGVAMHEICLSVMITSIKHPLVFVSLILSDVLENTFCLWCLARNARKFSTSRVSPEDDEQRNTRKSLTRRPSNVVSLVINKDDVSDKGTALFIAATLLQREAVETLVPIQAAAVLSLLYKVDVKSNSIVSGWSDEDWIQSMMYIGIDLGVELVVFVGTTIALKQIYPQFDAGRILIGLLRTHWVEMAMLSFGVWIGNLLFQSTYSGIDMSMKFEWLSCKDKTNSTWLGGFNWEC